MSLSRSLKLLSVACVVGVVGCAPPAQLTEVPSLPFDDYELSRLDHHTIEYAADLLAAECMRDLGFDWELLPPLPDEDVAPLNHRRYGLFEPRLAASHGYVFVRPPELVARDEVWERRERLPAAERRAALGTEHDNNGCLDQAYERLREDVPEPAGGPDMNDYSSATFDESERAPAVVEVFADWSACMRDAGFRYSHPFDASDDPAWAEGPRPSPQEIAVAQADVSCKHETGLVTVWSAAEARIQRALIAAHPEDFEHFLDVNNAELDAARRVIDELM
ncbi:hypothetical protein [Allonocardiopsis opalescens]|uniref:Lipoprotein n=1 Tax=Allonocardiopsis opalescens TaxID=1144618 RepID=A0A2T0Q126_9ACTN|nr:hypothetical protein [Allonocardiopsis opalescens]PRX97383.1 hypothetical protein CLV72_106421 [Allonocardiopsis opalescens]